MDCKYCHDEFCVNDKCPMRGDYCPVPDIPGVCQYEDRDDETYELTPKGCAYAALIDAGLLRGNDDHRGEVFWDVFSELMECNGYIREDPSETEESNEMQKAEIVRHE